MILIAVDIVLVVDRSGSMSAELSAKDENGNKQENGLTVMSIVKHAVKTVAMTLGPNDRLGVVIYDDVVQVLSDLKDMTPQNQDRLCKAIDTIKPRNATNIFEGVKNGLELLGKRQDCSRNPSLILLTDGRPNRRPSQGEVDALEAEQYRWKFRVPINTFGFGNQLDSKLLYDMSGIYNQGMFCFIPDGGMVGTVFINAVANIRCTVSNNLTIGIHNCGPVYFNRPRHFSVFGTVAIDGTPIEHTVSSGDDGFASFLNQTIDHLRKAINVSYSPQNAKQQIEKINELARSFNDRRVSAIMSTINDQVRLAFMHEYVRTWGLHYVRSLIRALELQIKTNFKDEALSIFTEPLFERLCKEGDKVFAKIPPPKPDEQVMQRTRTRLLSRGYTGPQLEVMMPSISQTMSTYNISSNPCFAGHCSVRMTAGYRSVKDIKKGDEVWTPDGPAKVLCVVRTECLIPEPGKAELVEIGKLVITPNHPIKLGDVWKFPKNVMNVQVLDCGAVYSFVLDQGHVVEIEGIQVICLGHGFTTPEILEHDYFGTHRVVDDLKLMNGWPEGLVQLKSGCIVPDGNSIRFVQN